MSDQIYYKANCGFYLTQIEGSVPITEEEHLAVLDEQSKGKYIIANKEGKPIAVNPPPHFDAVYNHDKNTWELPQELQNKLREQQRNKVWEVIKKHRYENGLKGVYITEIPDPTEEQPEQKRTINDWFQTGEEEKTKYLGLDKALKFVPGGKIKWKTYSNNFVDMDQHLLNAIFIAMVTKENLDHQNGEKLRLEMLDLDDPNTLDITKGWQPSYVPEED